MENSKLSLFEIFDSKTKWLWLFTLLAITTSVALGLSQFGELVRNGENCYDDSDPATFDKACNDRVLKLAKANFVFSGVFLFYGFICWYMNASNKTAVVCSVVYFCFSLLNLLFMLSYETPKLAGKIGLVLVAFMTAIFFVFLFSDLYHWFRDVSGLLKSGSLSEDGLKEYLTEIKNTSNDSEILKKGNAVLDNAYL